VVAAGSGGAGGTGGVVAAGSGGIGGTGGVVGTAGAGGSAGSGTAGSGSSAGSGAAGSGGSTSAIALNSGVPITGLSDASAGHQTLFTFAAPATATSVSVALTAGTGNADLYVRRAAAPTLNTWDCRPLLGSGENETCSLTNTGAVTYYVMVSARRAYTGATLTATYKLPPAADGVTELANGMALTGLSGAQGSMTYWKMSNVPARSAVTISVSGFSGNVDLYVRQGSQPTLDNYTCRPLLGSGRSETCQVSVRAAGTYYILLNGRTAYTNATLRGSY
jgi:serine protease